MLTRLSGWLLGLSHAWTLAATSALYVLFLAEVLPAQSAASRAYAGEWGAPDRQLFYTPDTLYAQLAGWGDAGRADYVDFRLGLDIAWAVVYTAFLVVAIGLAARFAFGEGDARRRLNLLPLVTMCLDYAENAAGILLVLRFPQRHEAVAWLAAAFTAGKWLTLVAAHAVLAYAVWAAIRERRRRRVA
jgi:hypothetical protein